VAANAECLLVPRIQPLRVYKNRKISILWAFLDGHGYACIQASELTIISGLRRSDKYDAVQHPVSQIGVTNPCASG